MKSLILIIIFVSCSRIGVKTPSSRFITPEASGKLFFGKVTLGSQSSSAAYVNLDDDKTNNPLDIEHDMDDLVFAQLIEIGLHEKIDIFQKEQRSAPSLLGLKYQFSGKSVGEAKKGDKSFAMTISGGADSSYDSDESNIFNGDVYADIYHSIIDFALIYGKRIEDDILAYVSLSYSQHKAEFELSSFDRPPLDGKKFNLRSDVYGVNFGITKYYKYTFLMSEISFQHTNWTHNEPTTLAFYAASVGWRWK